MGSLFMLLILLALSSAYGLLLGKRFEQTLPLACFTPIVVLYGFGLLDLLLVGVYVCIGLALLAGIWCVYCAFRDRKRFASLLLTPGCALFVALFAVVWLGHRGRLISQWDEFSHWALVVKNMFGLNALGNHPLSTVRFPGYQPGVALFQYFWARVGGAYVEADLYRSLNILTLSMLFPVFSGVGWRRMGSAALLFASVLLPPIMVDAGFYTSIYVDVVLGIVLAHMLYVYFSQRTFDRWAMLDLCAATFVLVLVKSSGFGLAAIALLMMLCDQVLRRMKRDRALPRETWHSWLLPLGVLLAMLLSKYSWDIYLQIKGTAEAWARVENITPSAVLSLFAGSAENYRYDIVTRFADASFSTPIGNGFLSLPYFAFLLVAAAFAGFSAWLRAEDRLYARRLTGLAAGLVIGGILYALSLMVLYVFSFEYREAMELASFGRYMGTYAVAAVGGGALLLAHSALTWEGADKVAPLQHQGARVVGVLTLVLALLINPRPLLDITAFSALGVRQTQEDREVYAAEERAAATLTSGDTVYLIAQNSAGYEFYASRYMLVPARVGHSSGNPWSLGAPYYDGDIWTEDLPLTEWMSRLAKYYTRVYLLRVDEQFIAGYGEAFEDVADIADDTMFEVVADGDTVRLVRTDF